MSGVKWSENMTKIHEIPARKTIPSNISTRGVVDGKTSKKELNAIDTSKAHHWYDKLNKSLRIVYLHEGRWKQAHELPKQLGPIHVTAHVEFDPKVVEGMDKDLPRSLANYVYNSAFDANKKRADALLDKFTAHQTATNRGTFKNQVQRLAVFAPEVAKEISRPRT